eukprot:gene12182-8715_t
MRSSRSHAILQFHIDMEDDDEYPGNNFDRTHGATGGGVEYAAAAERKLAATTSAHQQYRAHEEEKRSSSSSSDVKTPSKPRDTSDTAAATYHIRSLSRSTSPSKAAPTTPIATAHAERLSMFSSAAATDHHHQLPHPHQDDHDDALAATTISSHPTATAPRTPALTLLSPHGTATTAAATSSSATAGHISPLTTTSTAPHLHHSYGSPAVTQAMDTHIDATTSPTPPSTANPAATPSFNLREFLRAGLRGTLGADSTPLLAHDVADVSPGLLPGLDKHLSLLSPSASGSFFFADTAAGGGGHARAAATATAATPSATLTAGAMLSRPPSTTAARRPPPLQQPLSRTSSMRSVESFRLMQGSEYLAFKQQQQQQQQQQQPPQGQGQPPTSPEHPAAEDASAGPPTPSAATAAAARARMERQAARNSQQTTPASASLTPSAQQRYAQLRQQQSAFTFDLPDAGTTTAGTNKMTTQTDPPPVVHDKSIQTRSGLHPVAAPMKKLYLGQLDDFDEFVAAPQVDQITQTEAIFLVSDYYSSSLDEQRELTNLALLDPLEVACCFLELKKVVETQAEQIARLQELILNGDR